MIDWLTPPSIVEALGPFDLDPCSPTTRPWPTAATHYTIQDDGLRKPWHGRVWLNPPYGRSVGDWLRLLAMHGNGCALVMCRTDAVWFQTLVFGAAQAVLFMAGRVTFHRTDGSKPSANCGAATCLVAYGRANVGALWASGIQGRIVTL